MRFYLVRHGQTAWNAEQRTQGHEPIGLSERGRRQARLLAERLAAEQIGAIWSSDLPRAMETASAISEATGIAVLPDPDLRERHLGAFQGLTFEQIMDQFPGQWEGVFRGNAQPPGGETRAAVAVRMKRVLARALAEPPADSLVLVSHGGALRAAFAYFLNMSDELAWQFRVDNCGVSIIDTYPEGAIISILNDTCHLNGPDHPAW